MTPELPAIKPEINGEHATSAIKSVIFRVKLSILDDNNLRDNTGCPELGASLKLRQDYPILVGPLVDMRRVLYDGHRRKYSGLLVGLDELDAIEVPGQPTLTQIRQLQLRTDLHKKKLSDYEKSRTLKEIERENPGIQRKALGEMVEMNGPMVTQLLTEGIPAVEEAFRLGSITLAKRYALAAFEPDEQAEKLARAKGGMTVAELNGERKKKLPKTASHSITADSVKFSLSGRSVTIKGGGLSLSSVAKLLADASKEAEAGIKDGLAVTTWSKAMANRAEKAEAEGAANTN